MYDVKGVAFIKLVLAPACQVSVEVLTIVGGRHRIPEKFLVENAKQWGRGDSNPHALRHQILSLARLPIPALPREY